MAKDSVFKWEEGEALKHHCGFCKRPLAHPAAKNTCFGAHAEPCHRFHQFMFMRGRGHMCAACSTTEEAHYKRHHQMCEQIYSIYEYCNQDRSILPEEDTCGERTSSRDSIFTNPSSDASSSPAVKIKKAKKEHKRRTKETGRTAVITQEEIIFVDSVLHPAVPLGDDYCPRNQEEVNEIVKHLSYNAHCYKADARLQEFSGFAHTKGTDIKCAHINFEAELSRILDVFRITELQQQIVRTRGQKIKAPNGLSALVPQLKALIVEDLILVRRDDLEVKMRKTAYLRFTHRASFNKVEARYSDRDWKTGQKLPLPRRESMTSGSLTVVEEDQTQAHVETPKKSASATPVRSSDADRRHLDLNHRQVANNGKWHGVVSIRSDLTHKAKKEPSISSKRLPSLRIVANSKGTRESGSLDTSLTHKWNAKHLPKAVIGANEFLRLDANDGRLTTGSGVYSQHELTSVKTQETDRPMDKKEAQVCGSRERDAEPGNTLSIENDNFGFTEQTNGFEGSTQNQASIATRKKKKQIREAQRKARRVAEKSESHVSSVDGNSSKHADKMKLLTSPSSIDISDVQQDISGGALSPISTFASATQANEAHVKNEDDLDDEKFRSSNLTFLSSRSLEHESTQLQVAKKEILKVALPHVITLMPKESALEDHTSLLITTIGRHEDWKKFNTVLSLEGLARPAYLDVFDLCGSSYHNVTPCPFRNSGMLDCPYHRPHCGCVDPLKSGVLPCSSLKALKLGNFTEFDGKFCYCQAEAPEQWREGEFAECGFNQCPFKFFHWNCIENLGYDEVSRWYCTYCDKAMKMLSEVRTGMTPVRKISGFQGVSSPESTNFCT